MSSNDASGLPASNNLSDRPRLTEQEKKNNHIASEQKRRQAIREGFDRLSEMVPGMTGQGRSEATMLIETVKYMKEQLARKDELRAKAKQLGVSEGDFEHMYREERAKTNTQYNGR